MTRTVSGGTAARWDLRFLYTGIDDPQLDRDVKRWISGAERFRKRHRGNLASTLGAAIREFADLRMLGYKFDHYFLFRLSLSAEDNAVKMKKAAVEKKTANVAAECLTFFYQELSRLNEKTITSLSKRDRVVAKHLPWLKKIRVSKPHMLKEDVESALTKREPFGSNSWATFYQELYAGLQFRYRGKTVMLDAMFNILSTSKDIKERSRALRQIHKGLDGFFVKYASECLNTVIGAKNIEDTERGYKHPMQTRSQAERIPDQAVENLHRAVIDVGAPLARRFYRLKARHLGRRQLRWSDRAAPMPFADTSDIPWREAAHIVRQGYRQFSPTLGGLVDEMFAMKRVDAAPLSGRRGGGYNATFLLPGGSVSMTFMNYFGSSRDVMVLAHEVGHGVHGLLAGKAQGELMMRAPYSLAETASVFGEMLIFEYLKARMEERGDIKGTLSLVMEKLDYMLHTVVRMIALSNFERRIHGHDPQRMVRAETKRLSVEDFDRIWLETTREMYGDVFSYENLGHWWACVPHFHRVFYVYSYAFGELVAQSLFAKRHKLGDQFEALYLDLLRSGSSKDIVESLKPFGLDPTSLTLWRESITTSIGGLLDEAERLSAKMGVKV